MKEAISLRDAGYRSAVLCPPLEGRPSTEDWDGIQVFRPECLGNCRRWHDKIAYQALFFSPAWYRALKEVIATYQPDVLQVHDVWLGRTVFAARTTQRVVLDLHENMPAAVVEYLKGYRGALWWFNAIFKRSTRVLRYERSLLARCDIVFTVAEEARERVLMSHPELPTNKVINVENLETITFGAGTDGGPKRPGDDHFTVLYIGSFGPHRGIDTLVRAMTRIKEWKLNVVVHLVGARPSQYLDFLREQIVACDVASHVRVTDWVEANSVAAHIRAADIGCVPHHSNEHTNTTIPHKLFQYMSLRKPVLVSSSLPLAKTVKQANAGVVFTAGDADDCAAKIRDMYCSRTHLQTFALNGYRYVHELGHNWETRSAPILIAAYGQLFAPRGTQTEAATRPL